MFQFLSSTPQQRKILTLPKHGSAHFSTSNHHSFALESLATKTPMYIKIKKLEKLRLMLDDAKMMTETNPAENTGRAA
ncbi:hypothetical protein CHS0354_013466 [Potamilus streckersoni]|uniref:Uncharacterized protein n=1 Tax=Potamilus streckersoni TaxID=2493646 RepID=A0AAE0RYW6_9BIVA|nr:hypothetical protein CHS0354_013466 [Potamilus streckersoni]